MAIKIVEHCQVSPSQGAAREHLLPLLYFDIVWLPVHFMQTLYFYNFQCSESHFFETIVPNLKNSLSITLKHFLPLAGKIVFPLSSGMPVSHYVAGEDSVSLAIAISDADFIHLKGNQSRDADEFHGFIAEMPPAIYSPDHIKFPVMAIRVTLFPNQGLCVGLSHHHAIADGTTLIGFGFMQTWASINKFHGDEHLLASVEKVLPSYDRSVVQDANELTALFWNHMETYRPTVSSSISLPTYKLRGTFVLSEAEIHRLKDIVLNKKPDVARVSSYVVVCAHVWSCLAKSAAAAGETVADNEPEYLLMYVDCRMRLRPPLPDSYFGNCLTLALAESTHGVLRRNEGFVAAAEAIGGAIHKALDNPRGVLDGFGNQVLRRIELFGKRVLGVSGSPRFDLYGADYGWGALEKIEALHIDHSGSIFLTKSRGGGVEIGLSMAGAKMDAFASIFRKNIYVNSKL